MKIDVEKQLAGVVRRVVELERDGQPARRLILRRRFGAGGEGEGVGVGDLWEAVTRAERISRWFLPISGDLEAGGRYQLEGNAGGTITACDPSSHFAVTWEYGGETSWVDVRCFGDGGAPGLELTQTLLWSARWDEYGPGATGVGWEMALLGVELHLADPDAPKLDAAEFAASSEGRALIVGSSETWVEAGIAGGMDASAARAAGRRTTAFYTGEAVDGG